MGKICDDSNVAARRERRIRPKSVLLVTGRRDPRIYALKNVDAGWFGGVEWANVAIMDVNKMVKPEFDNTDAAVLQSTSKQR
jgi:hypothetical protein